MIYIALGTNQSAHLNGIEIPPRSIFAFVLPLLQQQAIRWKRYSNLWQSPAWPDPDLQPPYYNAVVEIETKLEPEALLKVLKQLEVEFGRKPSARNAPRPLDLDILDYNGLVSTTAKLQLPHPRMLERSFVLFPLQEIAPHWRDPIKNRTVSEWTAQLKLEDVEHLQWVGRFK